MLCLHCANSHLAQAVTESRKIRLNGRPRCPPRLPWDAVSGAPSSYRQPFHAQVSQEGKPTEKGAIQCPLHVLQFLLIIYISTTTLVSLSNSSTMKHAWSQNGSKIGPPWFDYSHRKCIDHVCESLNWIQRGPPARLCLQLSVEQSTKYPLISGMLTLRDYSWTKQTISRYALTAHRGKWVEPEVWRAWQEGWDRFFSKAASKGLPSQRACQDHLTREGGDALSWALESFSAFLWR
jgi:hypothetical protein